MKTQKMLEQAMDEEFSIIKIVHLPSVVACSQDLIRSLPDEIDDILDSSYPFHNCHPSMINFFANFNRPDPDEDDESDWDDLLSLQDLANEYILLEDSQFLVQFRTNKRTYHKDMKSWSSSAGWYCTQWIAAPTIAKAWVLGHKWAKDMHKEDFEESKKD